MKALLCPAVLVGLLAIPSLAALEGCGTGDGRGGSHDPIVGTPASPGGGGTAPGQPAPDPARDGGGGGSDGGGSACARGVSVSRKAFVDASVAYLRAAFGVTTGFDGGTVSYGEMWVALGAGDCPIADWSSLVYVAPVSSDRVPLELRATHGSVAAFWALNGRRELAFLRNGDVTAATPAPWQAGALGSNVVAVLEPAATPGQVSSLIAGITAAHPTVQVDLLEAIGIVTLSTRVGDFTDSAAPIGTVADIEAAAAQLRASPHLSSIEWSGLSFQFPNETWPATLTAADPLEPECLRKETRTARDTRQLSTLPSLAAPLGTGARPDPQACQ